MVAEGLRAMLAPHVEDVVLGRLPHPVDAVVLDLSALQVWGSTCLDDALACGPVLGVESLTGVGLDSGAIRERGVREIVAADVDGDRLVAATRRAAGRPVRAQGARGLAGVAADGAVAPLTARESQVVALAARGLTNVEIGEHLYLSINSVKTYLRTAFRRLDVANRAQAAAWLTQHSPSLRL